MLIRDILSKDKKLPALNTNFSSDNVGLNNHKS